MYVRMHGIIIVNACKEKGGRTNSPSNCPYNFESLVVDMINL